MSSALQGGLSEVKQEGTCACPKWQLCREVKKSVAKNRKTQDPKPLTLILFRKSLLQRFGSNCPGKCLSRPTAGGLMGSREPQFRILGSGCRVYVGVLWVSRKVLWPVGVKVHQKRTRISDFDKLSHSTYSFQHGALHVGCWGYMQPPSCLEHARHMLLAGFEFAGLFSEGASSQCQLDRSLKRTVPETVCRDSQSRSIWRQWRPHPARKS